MDNDQDNQPPVRFSAGTPPTAAYEVPAAPAVPRRGIAPGIVAAVAVVGLGVGFGAGYAAHGGGKTAQPAVATKSPASPSVAIITVHGSLTLRTGAYVNQDGTNCVSADGYSDISSGTAVTVGDQTGATIAVGQLQPGQVTGDGCRFGFDVQAPGNRTSYTITVSHRGTQVFSPVQTQEADMALG